LKIPPKGVIVYLSRRNDFNDLKKSLFLLYRCFTKRYNYPVIIFHDDFTIEEENKLLKLYSNIKFEKIKFELPPWIDKNKPFKTNFSLGYRHMCRFFSGELFKHEAIRDYDYYWRLDSDSFLHSNISYDIFKFMKKRGYIYGYISNLVKDGPWLVEGLWDFIKGYMKEKKIVPKFLNKYLNESGCWNFSLYYTNFEIAQLDFFRSNEYMQFYNAIDQNGGIYYYRWGDHAIHFFALSMLVEEIKIHCFKDIDYSHGNFRPNQIYFLHSLLKKLKILIYIEKYNLHFFKSHKYCNSLILKLIKKILKLLNNSDLNNKIYCKYY